MEMVEIQILREFGYGYGLDLAPVVSTKIEGVGEIQILCEFGYRGEVEILSEFG